MRKLLYYLFYKKKHTQRNIILYAEMETLFRVNYVHFLVRILSKTKYSQVNGWQNCGDPVVEAAEVSWVAWHLEVVCHCSLVLAGCAILSSMTGAHAEIHRDAVRGIVLRLALHLKLGIRMLNRIQESWLNCVDEHTLMISRKHHWNITDYGNRCWRPLQSIITNWYSSMFIQSTSSHEWILQ